MATGKEKKGSNPVSVRITPTCKNLWGKLADKMGVSDAAYLEVIIREKAEQAGIKPDEESGN